MIDQLARGAALKTARLDLRPLTMADAPRLARLGDDFEVARMLTRCPHPYSMAEAEALVRRGMEADPAVEVMFAIDLPGEGVVGTIGLDPDGVLAAEVGYWLGRPYWGRGYMTEAVRGVLGWARDAWGRRCVTARHFVDNAGSATVLAKAGFLYTGRTQMLPCLARGEPVLNRWMVWLA